jgi:hypothetical protein
MRQRIPMTDDLERHAGKAPDDRHPVREGEAPDVSDMADPRVLQPGEDPPDEIALSGPARTSDPDR